MTYISPLQAKVEQYLALVEQGVPQAQALSQVGATLEQLSATGLDLTTPADRSAAIAAADKKLDDYVRAREAAQRNGTAPPTPPDGFARPGETVPGSLLPPGTVPNPPATRPTTDAAAPAPPPPSFTQISGNTIVVRNAEADAAFADNRKLNDDRREILREYVAKGDSAGAYSDPRYQAIVAKQNQNVAIINANTREVNAAEYENSSELKSQYPTVGGTYNQRNVTNEPVSAFLTDSPAVAQPVATPTVPPITVRPDPGTADPAAQQANNNAAAAQVDQGTAVAAPVPVRSITIDATAGEGAGTVDVTRQPAPVAPTVPAALSPAFNYSVELNDGQWVVVDTTTGAFVSQGATPDDAISGALNTQLFSRNDDTALEASNTIDNLKASLSQQGINPATGLPYQEKTVKSPAPVSENDAVAANERAQGGVGGVGAPAATTNAAASKVTGFTNQAQSQSTLQARANQPSAADWRVRLSLAPGANYLYKNSTPGILAPLAKTDGVIFPYTPSIETAYKAKYNAYDLVHSNYRGYFYQNSSVDEIQIKGTFTAQDTREAAYLLAVIHFFRSVTKMFYGQDPQAGAPPPICYLNGLGQYQFREHPVLVSSFTYSLPTDVDYIRANGFNNIGLNLENRRNQSSGPGPGGSLGTVISIANRLFNNKLKPGATQNGPSQSAVNQNVTNQSSVNSTYVPTKMDISISLLPVQTRNQVSKQFSVEKFARGDLLRGGFW